MSKFPIQPIIKDSEGTLRFKKNAIVQYILDKNGPGNKVIDMNHLARQDFPKEDREQFAQLIGYSLSGFADLDYVSDETYATANRIAKDPLLLEKDVRISVLEETLDEARKAFVKLVSVLYGIHESTLEEFLEENRR